MKRSTSIIILAAIFGVLLVWDVYVALYTPKGDEFSAILLDWGLHYVTVGFAFGVLAGHLFWPQIRRVK